MDAGITTVNRPVSGNLLANDTDPNGDPLTVTTTPVSQPTSGTVVINPNGTCTYTPNPEFVGNDSFVYEVCDNQGACDEVTVHLTVFNQAPVVQNDVFAPEERGPVSGSVFANDSEPDSQPMTARLVTGPTGGTLDFNADGTFTYVPGPNFSGTDRFEYEACDPQGICSTAFVDISLPGNNTTSGSPALFPQRQLYQPRVSDFVGLSGTGARSPMYGGHQIYTSGNPLVLDSGQVVSGYDLGLSDAGGVNGDSFQSVQMMESRAVESGPAQTFDSCETFEGIPMEMFPNG